jgi:alpha/beta superfamily hydrolase
MPRWTSGGAQARRNSGLGRNGFLCISESFFGRCESFFELDYGRECMRVERGRIQRTKIKNGMAAGSDKSISAEASASSVSDETVLSPVSREGKLRSFFLDGEAGRLEALLKDGREDAPYCGVVCHPHPKGGGTMHNKVVYHAAKVIEGLGWPVLRFNFRGIGLSEGAYDGRAETRDVQTALNWLETTYQKPIVAAGFSFGAVMGLKAASERGMAGKPGVVGFAALGLPIANGERRYEHPYLAECRFPKLFLSGDRDEYAPLELLRTVVEQAPEPKRFVTVAGADHFFTGHLGEMQVTLRGWLEERLGTMDLSK